MMSVSAETIWFVVLRYPSSENTWNEVQILGRNGKDEQVMSTLEKDKYLYVTIVSLGFDFSASFR
jgi:hypothetical protein